MKTCTLTIEYDQEAENPHEWQDDTWQLVSLDPDYDSDEKVRHLRQCHFYDDDWRPLIGFRRKLAVGTAFELGKRHREKWYLDTYCRWRGGRPDGILIWTEPLANLGAKTYESRRKDAEADLEAYNRWQMGEVLWYSLLTDEEGEDDPGSCSGIYDAESLLELVRADLPEGYAISEINGATFELTAEQQESLPRPWWHPTRLHAYHLERVKAERRLRELQPAA